MPSSVSSQIHPIVAHLAAAADDNRVLGSDLLRVSSEVPGPRAPAAVCATRCPRAWWWRYARCWPGRGRLPRSDSGLPTPRRRCWLPWELLAALAGAGSASALPAPGSPNQSDRSLTCLRSATTGHRSSGWVNDSGVWSSSLHGARAWQTYAVDAQIVWAGSPPRCRSGG